MTQLARSLPDLLERLKAAGFALSTSEALDCAVLFNRLAESGMGGFDCETISQHLRPLLCKSPDAKVLGHYQQIVAGWWKQGEIKSQTHEMLTEGRDGPPETISKPPRNPLKVFGIVILLLVIVLAVWVKTDDSSVPAQPEPLKQSTQKDDSDEGQGFGDSKSTLSQNTPAPKLEGYWPTYRYTETLRPGWAWAAVGVPFSLLLFLQLPAWMLGRRRGSGGATLFLDGWDKDTAAKLLLYPLNEAVVSRYDRHFRGPADEIHSLARRPPVDEVRTVQATLGQLGIPKLCYRHARLRPSYLVLVEAGHDDAYPMLWAERLKKQGLEVDLRRFVVSNPDTAPLCRSPRTSTVPFDRLPNPRYGERLILVSDGEFLLTNEGEWRPWVKTARLERWPVRTIFAPKEPRDLLAGRRATLEQGMTARDPGFLLLPQEETALDAWSHWLAGSEMPVIVPAEASRYPRLLAEHGEARYLAEADQFNPKDQEVARLVAQLSIYLGENGFYWLCCCAVPPVVDPHLTLLLGDHYLQRIGARSEHARRYHLARNYRLLIRLPWLRLNQMPNWLRLALLSHLTLTVEKEVRGVVESLFSPQQPNPRGNLPINFALPGQHPGTGSRPALVDQKTALYLGFMSGQSARRLAMGMPPQWRTWYSQIRRPQSPWQTGRDWLAAAFARLLFRGSHVENGARSWPVILSLLSIALAAGLLGMVWLFPAKEWPMPWRGWVFTEQALPLELRHREAINSLSFGAGEENTLISASDDHTARLWNAQTGQPLTPPLAHTSRVRHAEISPDGRRVVTADEQGSQLWNAKTGQAVGPPVLDNSALLKPHFSPDSTRWVAGKNYSAHLRDARTGQPVSYALLHNYPVRHAGFSPDGKRLYTTSDDGTARWWDAISGEARSKAYSLNGPPKLAALSPDGSRLMIADRLGLTQIVGGASDRAVMPMIRDANKINHIAFSPDSQKLLSLGDDKSAGLWDAESGNSLGNLPTYTASDEEKILGISNPPHSHDGPINHGDFSPDNRYIVTASDDQTARVWDAETHKPLGEPLRHQSPVKQAVFSRDGRRIATASEDGTVKIWKSDIGSASLLPTLHENKINDAEFSPDGKQVVTASEDGTAQVWDSLTGEAIGQILIHGSAITQASFTPDKKQVITADSDGIQRFLYQKITYKNSYEWFI